MTRALFPLPCPAHPRARGPVVLTGPAGFGIGESLNALVTGQGEAVTLVMREIPPAADVPGSPSMSAASLGLSGAGLQGYLRNPLAETGSDRRLRLCRAGRGDRAADRSGGGLALPCRLAATHRAPPSPSLLTLMLAGPSRPASADRLILAGIAISARVGRR